MSKKTNTVLFMLVATLVNIVIMIILFIAGALLIGRFVNDANAASIWTMVVFVVAIGGSFFIYNLLVKAINKKFNLDDKLAPLWKSRRDGKRNLTD
ncbi:hypothetical protein [Parasphaerochaeta coccoides]|uniref:Leader peptide processing enzyme n=1 Tax=Parasphaerochaeta coccoides (strain ATCC BAA-1237 / DSM 17374 / SPN1) TaxID=760011 RepID=F4GJW2_PARC1|nr:hypothetical protein [Parasphaerochaeta coccoides]AEC01387.1 leader peptide processing enzyme [Parasphaerochaeta coccoides DSM 17374]